MRTDHTGVPIRELDRHHMLPVYIHDKAIAVVADATRTCGYDARARLGDIIQASVLADPLSANAVRILVCGRLEQADPTWPWHTGTDALVTLNQVEALMISELREDQ